MTIKVTQKDLQTITLDEMYKKHLGASREAIYQARLEACKKLNEATVKAKRCDRNMPYMHSATPKGADYDIDKAPTTTAIGGALRYNGDKLQWSLVDFESLEPMVKVLMYGASKYAPDNWKAGQDPRSQMESLLRHAFAFLAGENNDPESGESHLGHVLCNAMFMIYNQKHHPNLDNR